ncbi:MAG TPA: Hsp20/alpha crystallin family protein, partial [Candidatus Nanoarchaeia archaeon]|nr:Hsp20/alpha crystallin family protein [Candidatus Nanoarchaeia archaeon]
VQPLKALPAHEQKEIAPTYRRPVADVIETENALVANIELPGIDKQSIKVNVTPESIEIKAEIKQDSPKSEGNAHVSEQRFVGFYRYFALPKNVDTKKSEAVLKNGVLTLRIPKSESHLGKPLEIEIKDA